MITVGSLCAGIGGIDLGLERAGMRIAWHAEVDAFCRKVLANHWPNAELHGDIKIFSRRAITQVFRPVDLISAGYPCQPFSFAGKRRGSEDPRHLWPAVRRIVGVLRPRWVLLENVPGHLSMGIGRVLADLAALGFDCEWDVISAAQFGAPHLRRRVFIVGRDRYADGSIQGEIEELPFGRSETETQPNGTGEDVADSLGHGLNRIEKDNNKKPRTPDFNSRGHRLLASGADGAELRTQQGRGESERTGAPEPGDPGPVYREDGWHWRGEGGFWAEAEPSFQFVADGFSEWMAEQGAMTDVNAEKAGPREELRGVRIQDATQEDDGVGDTGKHPCLSPSKNMRRGLHGGHDAEVTGRSDSLGRNAARSQAQEEFLREMWLNAHASCPSRRRELAEQRTGQYRDALRVMSSVGALGELAQKEEAATALLSLRRLGDKAAPGALLQALSAMEASWGTLAHSDQSCLQFALDYIHDGMSPALTSGSGLPIAPLAGSRNQALRAIGNAVVPQVAEWIGRRIVDAERRAR